MARKNDTLVQSFTVKLSRPKFVFIIIVRST